ncbi:unnamed protein product, partial [Staurois parvus]
SLLVYIHGGYWQFLSKEESGFAAPPLVSHGIAVMAMDYDIAPGGDMDLMVSQVRRSIVAVLQRFPQITSIYLCGHSAGAHLAAMTLSTDWSQFLPPSVPPGALLVSGVYDLLPITHTYVNDAIKMSQEVAIRNSPIQLTALLKNHANNCQMTIAVAEHDSPEFHRQSLEYFQVTLCIKHILWDMWGMGSKIHSHLQGAHSVPRELCTNEGSAAPPPRMQHSSVYSAVH